MIVIEKIFNNVAEWYGAAFGEWLHIHWGIRTLILLLCTWAAVFVAAQLFKYLLGPLLVLFFYHVIFRAWNFIFIETYQEWIYINYYSKEKTFLSGTYLKLCDKVRDNRLRLEHTRYKGILMNRSAARAANRLMVIGLVAGTLWVAAFGLYYDFAYAPKPALEDGTGGTAANGNANGERGAGLPDGQPADGDANGSQSSDGSGSPDGSQATDGLGLANGSQAVTGPPAAFNSADIFWRGSDYLYLNEYAADGANVRDMPDGTGSVVVEVVWGEAVLENLGVYYEDAETPGMFWIKIRTAAGTEGYVSSRLLQTDRP